MNKLVWYIFSLTLIYAIVCGLAWHWALGLSFDWWKVPIIGALNGVLNMVASRITQRVFEKETWTESSDVDV